MAKEMLSNLNRYALVFQPPETKRNAQNNGKYIKVPIWWSPFPWCDNKRRWAEWRSQRLNCHNQPSDGLRMDWDRMGTTSWRAPRRDQNISKLMLLANRANAQVSRKMGSNFATLNQSVRYPPMGLVLWQSHETTHMQVWRKGDLQDPSSFLLSIDGRQGPPPPPQQGVGDPVAQLLVGQGAMSHLLIQMAQEMNRRSSGQGAGDPSQSSGQGSASGSRKEMKMDEKWIPSMPIASWKNWTSRGKELSGFKSWLEQFSGWLCLIHDAYGPELREAINSADPIRSFRDHDQTMRSKRLFHLLQQNFTGYSKIENLIKSQISALGITESNGFELLRLIRKEFSLLSRSEALGSVSSASGFEWRSQIICQTSWEKCRQRLNLFIQCWKLLWLQPSCKMSALVKVISILLYMRNLPGKVQEFLQLHQNATTVQQLFLGVQDFYIRTRVQGDMGSIHVTQPVGKPDVKDKTCFNCGKKGHLAENCPEPKKCSHCGKKGHLAKDCWEVSWQEANG